MAIVDNQVSIEEEINSLLSGEESVDYTIHPEVTIHHAAMRRLGVCSDIERCRVNHKVAEAVGDADTMRNMRSELHRLITTRIAIDKLYPTAGEYQKTLLDGKPR